MNPAATILFRRFAARVLVALAAGLVTLGCEREAAPPPPPVRPVLSLVVQPGVAEERSGFTGTVQPRYQTQLAFQVAGRMISRDANVGDRVSRGQQLATLDPTVPRLALASAQADLANAQAVLANAASTFARQQQLIRTGSVSQSQVDAATAGRDTAQARVAQVTASLQKAGEQLGYSTLASDTDGVVASWSVEVGQVVSPSQTVATIARPDSRDGVFDIPDGRVGLFAPGGAFTVSLLVDPAITATATVREIAPQADAATRSRRIRFTLDHPADAFRLGTTVRLALTERGAPGLAVPASAIREEAGRANVWIVDADKRARSRPVTLGARDGDAVAVVSGLAPGERVITAGVHSLADGQPVTLSAR